MFTGFPVRSVLSLSSRWCLRWGMLPGILPLPPRGGTLRPFLVVSFSYAWSCDVDGVALVVARRGKERRLVGLGARSLLVVFGVEVGRSRVERRWWKVPHLHEFEPWLVVWSDERGVFSECWIRWPLFLSTVASELLHQLRSRSSVLWDHGLAKGSWCAWHRGWMFLGGLSFEQ